MGLGFKGLGQGARWTAQLFKASGVGSGKTEGAPSTHPTSDLLKAFPSQYVFRV